MPGIKKPLVINGMPVLTMPVMIDLTNAGQLHSALVSSSGDGHATVADMTDTLFCDSAGFRVLLRAHRHALADGGELRLVMPAHSTVFRAFISLELDRLIPRFASLDQALSPGPAPVIRLPRPRPPAQPHLVQPPGNPGRQA